MELPENLLETIILLNRVSIPTRYPDDLEKMLKSFNKKRTNKILQESKEILKWLRKQL